MQRRRYSEWVTYSYRNRIMTMQENGLTGRAAVRAQITGTHRGEFFGIPATGKPIAIAIHEFHHLTEDRITHTWHLEDWFAMLNQVDAWPPR